MAVCLCKVNGVATEAGGGKTDSVVFPAANPAAEFCNPGSGDRGDDDVTGVVDEDDFDADVELEPVFIFSIIRYYFLL
jgi:hypothetical protein|tara:strand:- start:35 stop:268 length:234 start_codon:yes stop_codon:yes gene_type:complete